MSVRKTLAKEFLTLAVDELRSAETKVTLLAQHQLLTEWCEVYEDVPPRNAAERVVCDALMMARDFIIERMRDTQLTV